LKFKVCTFCRKEKTWCKHIELQRCRFCWKELDVGKIGSYCNSRCLEKAHWDKIIIYTIKRAIQNPLTAAVDIGWLKHNKRSRIWTFDIGFYG